MTPGTFGRPAVWAALLFGGLLAAQSDDLALKSHHAKELMAAGRFTEAIPIYEELCRALPENPGLLLDLGLAYQMAGRQQKAIAQFEAVLRHEPDNLPALLSLGVSRLETGEPARAVEPLQKVVKAQPGNTDARGMLANALLALDRFAEAAGQFRRLTAQAPADPRGWYGLGRSYESLATGAFAELEKAAPESPYTLWLIADSRVQRRQYRSAFYFYRQALDKAPPARGLHAALAEVYRKMDHADWAAQEEQKERLLPAPDCAAHRAECAFQSGRYLDAAAAAKTRTPESWFWQARAYNKLALEAFSQLGDLPPSAELHEVKAGIESSQGEHLDAAKDWREALQFSPGNRRYQQELATSLFQAGDYKNALPLLTELLRDQPRSAELNYLTGGALLHLGEADKAIPYLESAVRSDPKLLAAHASLGLAYGQKGEAGKAVPHLEAALPLDEDGSLHYQLARACQASGRPARARQMMEKYQQIVQSAETERKKLEQEVRITPP